jgi:hypothetical protein
VNASVSFSFGSMSLLCPFSSDEDVRERRNIMAIVLSSYDHWVACSMFLLPLMELLFHPFFLPRVSTGVEIARKKIKKFLFSFFVFVLIQQDRKEQSDWD